MAELGFEETGVTTIPKVILTSISSRDNDRYKPSYIVRLINRSLPATVYKSYRGRDKLRKGHFISDKQFFHVFETARISITGEDGAMVEYRGITMPTYRSKEILTALDKKFSSIDLTKLNSEEIYRLAAFCTIITATAHPFPDGSGRAAVGVADVIIRKNLEKNLNFAEVQRDDSDFSKIVSSATVSMFPGIYNMDVALENASKSPDKFIRLFIPNIPGSSADEFINDFTKSIIDSVNAFNPEDNKAKAVNKDLNLYVNNLARFYEERSVPLE